MCKLKKAAIYISCCVVAVVSVLVNCIDGEKKVDKM